MDSTWADESRPPVDPPSAQAALAQSLLSDPESGVTRLCMVGLPEREAILVFVEARRQGLEASVARGSSGGLTVTLAAPEQLTWRQPKPPRPWAGLRRAAAALLGILGAGPGGVGGSI